MSATIDPAGQGEPRIHPFFTPARSVPEPDPKDNADHAITPNQLSQDSSNCGANKMCENIEAEEVQAEAGRKSKRRKVDVAETSVNTSTPKSARGRRATRGPTTSLDVGLTASSSESQKDGKEAKDNKKPKHIKDLMDIKIPKDTKDKASKEVRPSQKSDKDSTASTAKATHPFFLGQAKTAATGQKDEMQVTPNETEIKAPKVEEPKAVHTSATPCSPKKPRASAPASAKLPQFGSKLIAPKFPGQKAPAWPWKGTAHVRGEDSAGMLPAKLQIQHPLRKSKGQSVAVSAAESVLFQATKHMQIPHVLETLQGLNSDHFTPAPVELRLPEKHFESGKKLQQRISGVLKCTVLQDTANDETGRKGKVGRPSKASKASVSPSKATRLSPQAAPLYNALKTQLPAFDKSECETAMWTHKYAPMSASEVLQSGQEVFMLRDWLQALIVQSVHTGDDDKAKKGKASVPRKRKRKTKKLDDFIVSSDDEDNELIEVSDGEPDWSPSGCHGVLKKTVIRSGALNSSDSVRLANTVVISGPHGSGKTAAVYAVAKELDFEIFEINPSSRRSGKDIIERIGNMTTNHLVQQQKTGEQELVTVEPEEIAEEVKTGKQATMSAFFKPQGGKPKKATKPAPTKAEPEAKKETAKSQKQSLILLDEADILYEKDQQFWQTVVALAAQSKRPFVITCNDESMLPLQSLNLHAIMRFTAAPFDQAVDRMLLIAANEGHALDREAVESLYATRGRDLRAATTDLNYWCQLGVGDRRGGFEWFLPRWPKGVDLDENGDVIRVVSKGTYLPGLGSLGRDSLVDKSSDALESEQELLSQAWASWQLDLEHWHDSDNGAWADATSAAAVKKNVKLELLTAYDEFAEAMSAADLCSSGSFGLDNQNLLDATLPPMPAKSREDYTIGLRLLDAPVKTQYDPLVIQIPQALQSLGQALLRSQNRLIACDHPAVMHPFQESQALESIRTNDQVKKPYAQAIARIDFAFAFDPIAAADTGGAVPTSYLDPSVFDRTLKLIVLDVAPYVRGIVAYESYLQKQREKLNAVMGEGGNGRVRKRMRTTRAALSALEGGARSTTRGERWFKADLNTDFVLKTAGEEWERFGMGALIPTESCASSVTELVSEPSSETAPRRRQARTRRVEEDSADELALTEDA